MSDKSVGSFLNAARFYLGPPPVTENPPHSNHTIIGQLFGLDGYAWCCEFASVCAKAAGFDWFHTASVYQAYLWAKEGFNGMKFINPGSQLPGDMPIYNVSEHIGLLEGLGGGLNTTIEGNWGDKVCRLETPYFSSTITGYARLPFVTQHSAPPAPGQWWPNPSFHHGTGVLGGGDTGQVVGSLQIRLNHLFDNYISHHITKLGIIPGHVKLTGTYDANTQAAVKWLQEHSGLKPDAQFGPTTQGLLERLENNFKNAA